MPMPDKYDGEFEHPQLDFEGKDLIDFEANPVPQAKTEIVEEVKKEVPKQFASV